MTGWYWSYRQGDDMPEGPKIEDIHPEFKVCTSCNAGYLYKWDDRYICESNWYMEGGCI